MFKIFTGHIDIPFDDLFIPSSITWTRGHPFKLRHGFSRTLCRKYFFTQRVVSLWNSLPQHFFVSSSVSLFKSQVDEYLFKHGYRWVFCTYPCECGFVWSFLSLKILLRRRLGGVRHHCPQISIDIFHTKCNNILCSKRRFRQRP